jgi:hypothetical protein
MMEIGSLQAIVHVLDLPIPDDGSTQGQAYLSLLGSLRGPNGPLDGCTNALKALSKLLEEPKTTEEDGNRRTKRQKALPSMTMLAWPLKRNKAKSLFEEIAQYKSTIPCTNCRLKVNQKAHLIMNTVSILEQTHYCSPF